MLNDAQQLEFAYLSNDVFQGVEGAIADTHKLQRLLEEQGNAAKLETGALLISSKTVDKIYKLLHLCEGVPYAGSYDANGVYVRDPGPAAVQQ